jgi:hypothetical protein
MSFATNLDVQKLLARALSDDELTQAQLALDLISGEIEGITGQTFRAEEHTSKLAGTWSRDLDLPRRPVTAVDSVTLNGLAVAAGAWAWNERSLIRRGVPVANGFDSIDVEADWEIWGIQGAGWEAGLHWGGPASTVEVVYTAGPDAVPAVVKSVALSAGLRFMQNPAGIRSEALGAYNVTYSIPADGQPYGLLLNEIEVARLRRHFARTGGTIVSSRS